MGRARRALPRPPEGVHLPALPTSWAGRPTTSRLRREPFDWKTWRQERVPVEHHTSLHHRHVAHGAVMDWAGSWKRPSTYGDVELEYWAVRRTVSVMDVSTLGKYRVAGPDATAFLSTSSLPRRRPQAMAQPVHAAPERGGLPVRRRLGLQARRRLVLCQLYFERRRRRRVVAAEWADERRLRVHIANMTASRSAINVAGLGRASS